MRRFIYLFLLILGLWSCQNTTTHSQEKDEKGVLPFYETHQGNWHGRLNIYKKDSLIRELGMTFKLKHLRDSLTFKKYLWKVQYEGQDVRNYRLLVDTVNNIYMIDEQNGIVLPAQLNNSNLSNWFSVMGNMLFVNFDFSIMDEVKFTVNMRSKKPIGFTGQDNETIDSVACYEVSSYQIGVLIRATQ